VLAAERAATRSDPGFSAIERARPTPKVIPLRGNRRRRLHARKAG